MPSPLAALDRLHERVFVAGYTRIQERSEAAGMREIRRDLVAGARGRVLEIGAGTGLNLDHYGPGVDDLCLVEPAPAMRAALEAVVATGLPAPGTATRADAPEDGPSRDAPAGSGRTVRVVDGTAEELPAEDGSVDAVVGTFVLCSVADPAAVLREVARALRPGGAYLGLEHVRSPTAGTARAQRLIAPAWRFAVRGCRCDQDAEALVAGSPLHLESAVPFRGPGQPWPVRPGVRLVARRP